MGGTGKIVSPYDASYAVADAYPEDAVTRNDDPILEGYTRAYGAAFAAYARGELGFASEMTYSLLNEEVNRRWEWNGSRGGDSRSLASASTDIRDLLSVIPSFKLMIAHGYSDALTPMAPAATSSTTCRRTSRPAALPSKFIAAAICSTRSRSRAGALRETSGGFTRPRRRIENSSIRRFQLHAHGNLDRHHNLRIVALKAL